MIRKLKRHVEAKDAAVRQMPTVVVHPGRGMRTDGRLSWNDPSRGRTAVGATPPGWTHINDEQFSASQDE